MGRDEMGLMYPWTHLHFRDILAPWRGVARGSVKLSKVRKEYKGNQACESRKCNFGQKNSCLNFIGTWAWASCEEGWYHRPHRHVRM